MTRLSLEMEMARKYKARGNDNDKSVRNLEDHQQINDVIKNKEQYNSL